MATSFHFYLDGVDFGVDLVILGGKYQEMNEA